MVRHKPTYLEDIALSFPGNCQSQLWYKMVTSYHTMAMLMTGLYKLNLCNWIACAPTCGNLGKGSQTPDSFPLGPVSTWCLLTTQTWSQWGPALAGLHASLCIPGSFSVDLPYYQHDLIGLIVAFLRGYAQCSKLSSKMNSQGGVSGQYTCMGGPVRYVQTQK